MATPIESAYMPAWSCFRDELFCTSIFVPDHPIGIVGWSMEELYEAMEAAKEANEEGLPEEEKIAAIDDYYRGYVYFTNNSLDEWFQGLGLRVEVGATKLREQAVFMREIAALCERINIPVKVIDKYHMVWQIVPKSDDIPAFFGDPRYRPREKQMPSTIEDLRPTSLELSLATLNLGDS